MNATLAAWNAADESAAIESMLACCGSKDGLRPWRRSALSRTCGRLVMLPTGRGATCKSRIGWRRSHVIRASASARLRPLRTRPSHDPVERSAAWSRKEQLAASAANEMVLAELADDNQRYEQRFGFTYIVCATGKSATEMLTILKRRLGNDRESELREAAEQQRQIMQIRLGKWLVE